MRYRVTVPATMEQGSTVLTARDTDYQTKAQDALQDYNSMRAHDGLPPIRRMPKGTTYIRMGNYESLDSVPQSKGK